MSSCMSGHPSVRPNITACVRSISPKSIVQGQNISSPPTSMADEPVIPFAKVKERKAD